MSERGSSQSGSGDAGRRLRVVLPEHELRGHAPLAYEKLVKKAQPGSQEHRGAMAIAHALAGQAVRLCVAPSARSHLVLALSTLESFVSAGRSLQELAKSARTARANAFAALPVVEAQTLAAVTQAAKMMPAGSGTTLYEHAHHTVERFVGLSVHHAIAAVCHALDAVEEPSGALPVPSDACGALAYGRTALGSARNPAFQNAALEQARWEHERSSRAGEAPLSALELQIFHEYLGARWRAHADEERRATDEFITWALGPLARDGTPGA